MLFTYCKKSAYDNGSEEERFIGELQEWYQQKEGKTVAREKVVEAINNLYGIKAADFNNGYFYFLLISNRDKG